MGIYEPSRVPTSPANTAQLPNRDGCGGSIPSRALHASLFLSATGALMTDNNNDDAQAWNLEPASLYPSLSTSRLCEHLDYATVYGEWDENTEIGATTALSGKPFCAEQREAILNLKLLLRGRGVNVENWGKYDDDESEQIGEPMLDRLSWYGFVGVAAISLLLILMIAAGFFHSK
jgi:hypothetical protein